jgi:hypothetical protein
VFNKSVNIYATISRPFIDAGKKNEIMILCCPVCQGTDVYEVAGGYVGQVYRCKKCGYRGSFVLEIDEKELLAEKDGKTGR